MSGSWVSTNQEESVIKVLLWNSVLKIHLDEEYFFEEV